MPDVKRCLTQQPGHRFALGNKLGLGPVDEIGKIRIASNVDLRCLYQFGPAQLHHLQERTVQDGGSKLTLDVISQDDQLLLPELLLNLGSLRDYGRDAVHEGAPRLQRTLGVIGGGFHAARGKQIQHDVGVARP